MYWFFVCDAVACFVFFFDVIRVVPSRRGRCLAIFAFFAGIRVAPRGRNADASKKTQSATASQTDKTKPQTSTTLPGAASIPSRLPLTKKRFVAHHLAPRMCLTHVRDISLIVRQPDHQPHGLPEVSAGVAHIVPKS
jgi:hypothetical protein